LTSENKQRVNAMLNAMKPKSNGKHHVSHPKSNTHGVPEPGHIAGVQTRDVKDTPFNLGSSNKTPLM
jgi:hypothetical protein